MANKFQFTPLADTNNLMSLDRFLTPSKTSTTPFVETQKKEEKPTQINLDKYLQRPKAIEELWGFFAKFLRKLVRQLQGNGHHHGQNSDLPRQFPLLGFLPIAAK